MNKAPYMPMYWGDFFADTLHLQTLEKGTYLILIGVYWRRGKALPDDNKFLGNAVGLSPRMWLAVRATLEPFFKIEDGVWRHDRVEFELLKLCERSAKAKQSQSQRIYERNAIHIHSQIKEESKKEEDFPSGPKIVIDNTTTKYAFENGIVRLTEEHLAKWQKTFSCLNVEAELEGMAHWLGEEHAKGKNWYVVASAALNKKNGTALDRRAALATGRPPPEQREREQKEIDVYHSAVRDYLEREKLWRAKNPGVGGRLPEPYPEMPACLKGKYAHV